MSKVRVAVIGLNRGLDHADAYVKNPNAELVALCDTDKGWLDFQAKRYGISRTYTNYQDLLADPEIDAVSICTPTGLHGEHTLAAFRAGKHVLCEKPMAMNAAQAQSMIDAAKSAGKTFMICQNRRFLPESQQLKKCMDQVGKVYFVRAAWVRPMGTFLFANVQRQTGSYDRSWFNRKDEGGGVLRDLGVHLIDLVMWVMGFPAMVKALGSNYGMFTPRLLAQQGDQADAEDFASGMIRFANGAGMQVEMCFGSHSEAEDVVVEILGDRGGAFIRRRNLTIVSQQHGAQTVMAYNQLPEGPGAEDEFIDAILQNRPPMVTAEQARQVIAILDALYADGITLEK